MYEAFRLDNGYWIGYSRLWFHIFRWSWHILVQFRDNYCRKENLFICSLFVSTVIVSFFGYIVNLMSGPDSSTVPVEKMPLQYFWGEIRGGNSLRITASVGNEKKRQRVYNTMFHVPWRCELVYHCSLFF